MKNISLTVLKDHVLYATAFSGFALAAIALMYFAFEPQIGHTQTTVATSSFQISQTVTDESSFSIEPVDVTMVGNIAGLTGGNALGETQFEVTSNNTGGYTVTIEFEDNTGDEAMLGEVSGSDSILDYLGDVGGQPSDGFITSTAAQFAYTVTSSSSAHTAQSFIASGGNCNQVAGTQGDCWKAPSTTAFTIVDNSGAAPSGARSTLEFQVDIPSNPIPTVPADTYTATATLSLILP